MTFHAHRAGTGKPLLLVHGIGSSWKGWRLVMKPLIERRDVIAIDLPGHGGTPAEGDSGTFAGLARSLEAYLVAEDLVGVDMVGHSMGARLVLEMARRGRAGAVVSFNPGGFWQGWERDYFQATLTPAVALLKVLRSRLPGLSHNAFARTVLLAQLSARPWALNGDIVETELVGLAETPTVNALIRDLATSPWQEGPAAPSTGRVTIGWGRQDRLLFPRQAARALAAFPSAKLRWFDDCGHAPIWDQSKAAAEAILETVA